MTSGTTPSATLHKTNATNTSVATLAGPATTTGGNVTFTAPANTTLDANSTYFILIQGGSNVEVEHTNDNSDDTRGMSDWTVLDNGHYRAYNTTSSFITVSLAKQIRVNGTALSTDARLGALEIADTDAAENAGHLLFDVTLSRALQNTVKVNFETISGGTATEGLDYHARRSYTHVILAGDRTAKMGFALIEDTISDAGETVKARLSNARMVDAYGNVISVLDITTDEATGTITAPATTTTNVPGLTIGIQDATGDEDDGWLVFRVRLSRKYDDYVCYDFETISGGTATEGTDYSKRPKVGQWMQTGKRVDQPFVRIIDDSQNDDGETVMVKISNARLCDDASQTLSITRAEATGTIRNTESASGNNNWSDDSAGTAVTPVPALPLAGIGLLGVLLALLGSSRGQNDRHYSSKGR